MPTVTSLQSAFERHAQRRAAGVPTPAVLVGLAAAESWLDAHRACGIVRASAAEPERVVAAYLDATVVQKRLAARIEARVLAARDAQASGTRERTSHETALWRDVARDALLSAGDADAALVVSNDRGERTLGAVVSVLGQDAPALLVDAGTDVDTAVRAAIAIAESAPRAHLAVATDARAWKTWTETPGREHAKALLRALVVESAVPGALEEARSLGARAREHEGYFVVRVLADDITDRLDETVASIHRVMEKRR